MFQLQFSFISIQRQDFSLHQEPEDLQQMQR